ncbi:MAG: cell division protein ZipA [Gammaproteobacteria bacterium]
MALHWILLFVAVIFLGLIAWHSTRFSTSSLRKVFNRRSNKNSDHVLGLSTEDEEQEEYDDDDDFLIIEKPATSEKPSKSSEKAPTAGVICLNIKAPDGEAFLGEGLVTLLRTAGLYFGDLNIFHYEVERDGDFYPLFSLASAFEPGSFNLDTIDDYVTPGLTLFMEVDAVDEPREVFALMLETARNLAGELQGTVCDDKWKPFTQESLERYSASLL